MLHKCTPEAWWRSFTNLDERTQPVNFHNMPLGFTAILSNLTLAYNARGGTDFLSTILNQGFHGKALLQGANRSPQKFLSKMSKAFCKI